MPQMAPLNWLFLLIFTTMILTILNSMNYFFFMYKPKNTFKLTLTKKNWKW